MPEIRQIAADYRDRVRVLKVDLDEDKRILEAFGASRLPALLLFHDGVEVDRLLPVPGLVGLRVRRMLDAFVGT